MEAHPGLCIIIMHATILLKVRKIAQSRQSITARKWSEKKTETKFMPTNITGMAKRRISSLDSYPVMRSPSEPIE